MEKLREEYDSELAPNQHMSMGPRKISAENMKQLGLTVSLMMS